jgi:hypothetical protein
MEINFKGNLVFERLSRHREFYPDLFLYTKHSINNDQMKLGVKIQKDNKESYARELRNFLHHKKVVLTEVKTFEELSAFGINNAGRYESQMGNDDVAMTCVNLITYFDSIDFYETVEDMYDTVDLSIKKEVETRMASDGGAEDVMDVFRVIRDMDNRQMPGIPKSTYNGKSDNPYLKKRT